MKCVRTQRAGASDDEDRLGGAIPGPGLDPAAEELDRWGAQIRERITALQDHIVPAGEITHQKIIVRLQGPRLPNLSLVDLPGLRAVDEERHAGLKEKLRRMVTEVVRSPNAIILCVGQAGVDPANWAGRGLAKEVDVLERRTIGVVTKVDTLFGVPDTELQRATQAQLKAVLDDVGSDTPYYAAYNPKPDDEAEFLKHGIDLQVNYIAHATTLSRVSCTLMWSPLSPRHCGLDVAGVERDHRLQPGRVGPKRDLVGALDRTVEDLVRDLDRDHCRLVHRGAARCTKSTRSLRLRCAKSATRIRCCRRPRSRRPEAGTGRRRTKASSCRLHRRAKSSRSGCTE